MQRAAILRCDNSCPLNYTYFNINIEILMQFGICEQHLQASVSHFSSQVVYHPPQKQSAVHLSSAFTHLQ